jgi:hypothetical protein
MVPSLNRFVAYLTRKVKVLTPQSKLSMRGTADSQGEEHNFKLEQPHVCLLMDCPSILSILDFAFIFSTVRTYSPHWLKVTGF